MAFFSLVLVMLPFLAAIIGVVIIVYFLVGICILISGISGVVLNTLYTRKTGKKRKAVIRYINIGEIVVGIILMILPGAYSLITLIKLFFMGN